MKTLRNICLGICLLGLLPSVWAQSGSASPGILGRLDPKTGWFKPLPPQSEALSGSVTTLNGKIVVNLFVAVKSVFPVDEVYSCGASANGFDIGSSLSFSEFGSVATTNNGGMLTCSVIIPYTWRLTTPGSDMVNVDFSITAVGSTNGLPSRTVSQGILSMPVPPNNKVTTFNLPATI